MIIQLGALVKMSQESIGYDTEFFQIMCFAQFFVWIPLEPVILFAFFELRERSTSPDCPQSRFAVPVATIFTCLFGGELIVLMLAIIAYFIDMPSASMNSVVISQVCAYVMPLLFLLLAIPVSVIATEDHSSLHPDAVASTWRYYENSEETHPDPPPSYGSQHHFTYQRLVEN